MLGDKDRAFVIHFDREVELLQDLTPLRPKLQAALQLLDASPRDTADDDESSEHRHAGTLLYDAIYLASNELMKKQQGRKALFVLTDGVDRGSKKTLEDAVEAAQRSDTLVYSILFPGAEHEQPQEHHHGGRPWRLGRNGWRLARGGGGGGWPGGGGGARAAVAQAEAAEAAGIATPRRATRTARKFSIASRRKPGGRLFEVSKKMPVDQIYAAIEEELRNQYSLGYSPSPADTGAGYHKIHLTTNEQGPDRPGPRRLLHRPLAAACRKTPSTCHRRAKRGSAVRKIGRKKQIPRAKAARGMTARNFQQTARRLVAGRKTVRRKASPQRQG